MKLTDKHIECIKDFLITANQTESYKKYFTTGNHDTDRVAACKFFKRSEVQNLLNAFSEARDRAMVKATEKVYERFYSEAIATELELDMLHTKIVRGQIEVEEIYPIREIKTVEQDGKQMKIETTVFKREKRRPTVLEVQRSAKELYLRKGSYKPLKIDTNQDDQKAAELSKGNNTTERFFILSDGSKIPMAD